jgi:N-acetylneuraminate synthase
VIDKQFNSGKAEKGQDCEFSLKSQKLRRLYEKVKGAWMALGKAGFDWEKKKEQCKIR